MALGLAVGKLTSCRHLETLMAGHSPAAEQVRVHDAYSIWICWHNLTHTYGILWGSFHEINQQKRDPPFIHVHCDIDLQSTLAGFFQPGSLGDGPRERTSKCSGTSGYAQAHRLVRLVFVILMFLFIVLTVLWLLLSLIFLLGFWMEGKQLSKAGHEVPPWWSQGRFHMGMYTVLWHEPGKFLASVLFYARCGYTSRFDLLWAVGTNELTVKTHQTTSLSVADLAASRGPNLWSSTNCWSHQRCPDAMSQFLRL